MNIIAEKPPLVKWSEKKIRNQMVANRMISAGFVKRGRAMLECGTILQQKTCPDCGKSFISSANLCRDRMCPTCQWRLSLQRFAEMCNTLAYIGDLEQYEAGFLTLTVRNCEPKKLKETLSVMSKAWHRMLCTVRKQLNIIGWARSVEITYNAEANTFHPHYHVILLLEAGQSEDHRKTYFTYQWGTALGVQYVPQVDYRWIRSDCCALDNQVFTHAILETYKYAVKSDDIAEMPLVTFRHLVNGIGGARLVSYGGIIKDARRALDYKETDKPEEPIKGDICDCGASLQATLLRWSFEEGMYKKMVTQLENSPIYQYLPNVGTV